MDSSIDRTIGRSRMGQGGKTQAAIDDLLDDLIGPLPDWQKDLIRRMEETGEAPNVQVDMRPAFRGWRPSPRKVFE